MSFDEILDLLSRGDILGPSPDFLAVDLTREKNVEDEEDVREALVVVRGVH